MPYASHKKPFKAIGLHLLLKKYNEGVAPTKIDINERCYTFS